MLSLRSIHYYRLYRFRVFRVNRRTLITNAERFGRRNETRQKTVRDAAVGNLVQRALDERQKRLRRIMLNYALPSDATDSVRIMYIDERTIGVYLTLCN